MSDYPPSALDLSAMETVCPQTVSGWLWYCDEHDSLLVSIGARPDINVWQRTQHKRAR